MKKRLNSIFLLLALLLSLTVPSPVYANELTISVSVSTPDEKGEFDAEVSIAGNPGIASFNLKLGFDNARLEPLSITQGAALSVGSIVSNVNNSGIDYVSTVWFDAVGTNANGLLYTVKFKLKDDLPGKIELSLETDNRIFDNTDDMNPVSFILNGTVLDLGPPTYTINASTLISFGSLQILYTQPAAQTVTITNTGTGPITLTQPISDKYYIGDLSTTILTANGATATFTVCPKAGLAIGNHDETITVSGSNGASATVNASVTVLPPMGILSVTPDSNNNKVIVDLNIPQQSDAVLIVAIYNADGILIDIALEQPITQSGEISVYIDVPITDGTTVKAMLWKDLLIMQPLYEEKTVVKNDMWVYINA